MISIWLTPAEKGKTYLEGIIKELASEYHAPIFSPHCTLYSPVNIGKIELEQILKDASAGIGSISIMMYKLNHTQNIWKTVFIELELTSELEKLQSRIVNLLPNPTPYSFSPHISLIYKEMPDEKKEEIICNLSVRNSYKMDKITAMQTGLDVKNWEKVAEVHLHA